MEKIASYKKELMEMVASELRMAIDDNFCDVESDLIVMLQDDYDLSEDEANQLVKESMKLI